MSTAFKSGPGTTVASDPEVDKLVRALQAQEGPRKIYKSICELSLFVIHDAYPNLVKMNTRKSNVTSSSSIS